MRGPPPSAPARAKTQCSLVHPLPPPRARAMCVHTSGRSCAQVRACTSQLWSVGPDGPPERPNCVLCVCPLCGFESVQVCGLSVCLCLCPWQRLGRGGSVRPRVPETRGPHLLSVHSSNSSRRTPAPAHSLGKSRAQQWLAGGPTGHLCCALLQGQQLIHGHDLLVFGPWNPHPFCPEALQLHFPVQRIGPPSCISREGTCGLGSAHRWLCDLAQNTESLSLSFSVHS